MAPGRIDRDDHPAGASPAKGTWDVSAQGLINITASASDAFGGFDWTEHAGKGVRLFVQGFG